MFQGLHEALSKLVGVYTSPEKSVDIRAFIAPCEQAIQIPQVYITIGIPAKALVRAII